MYSRTISVAKQILVASLSVLLIVSCNTDHKTEFYRIQRDDIHGYEEFIRKYPNSSFIQDARERIETAKEEKRLRHEKERIEVENRRLESLYGGNTLSNGSQPYIQWYGKNQYYNDYTDHSEIIVEAPHFEFEDDPEDFETMGAFFDTDLRRCTRYVPEGSVEAYRQAPGWKLFKQIKLI